MMEDLVTHNISNRGAPPSRVAKFLAISIGIVAVPVLILFGLLFLGGIHAAYKVGWMFSDQVVTASRSTLAVGMALGIACMTAASATQTRSVVPLFRSATFGTGAIVVIAGIQILTSSLGIALQWWEGAGLFSFMLVAFAILAARAWANQLVGMAAFVGVVLLEASIVLLILSHPLAS